MCIPPCPTCPGCVCDYLAECNAPATDAAMSDSEFDFSNTTRKLNIDAWFSEARKQSAVQSMMQTIGTILTNTTLESVHDYLSL